MSSLTNLSSDSMRFIGTPSVMKCTSSLGKIEHFHYAKNVPSCSSPPPTPVRSMCNVGLELKTLKYTASCSMDGTQPARCPSLILSYSTRPQLLAANDLLLVTILPFLEFHKNGSLHTVMYPFVSGLFKLVSYFWNPFLVLGSSVIHPLNCWPVSQCMSSP